MKFDQLCDDVISNCVECTCRYLLTCENETFVLGHGEPKAMSDDDLENDFPDWCPLEDAE